MARFQNNGVFVRLLAVLFALVLSSCSAYERLIDPPKDDVPAFAREDFSRYNGLWRTFGNFGAGTQLQEFTLGIDSENIHGHAGNPLVGPIDGNISGTRSGSEVTMEFANQCPNPVIVTGDFDTQALTMSVRVQSTAHDGANPTCIQFSIDTTMEFERVL